MNEYIQENEEPEIDKAIKKLASIADYTHVTEDMRKTAGFMLEAKYRDNQSRLIKNLQNRLLEAEVYAREAYNRGVEDSLSVIEKKYFGLFERKEAIEEITKLLNNK